MTSTGHDVAAGLAGAFLTTVFSAGVVWDQFRRMRSDLNGLGAKLGRMQKVLLVFADEPDKREKIAAMLNGDR